MGSWWSTTTPPQCSWPSTPWPPGKEVVISRGQLVEIGGSFRLPEIMAASGAILREVGTTNKTYLKDFEKAITSETAVLLKVHPSNFRIMGFTHEVTLRGDGGPGAALRP